MSFESILRAFLERPLYQRLFLAFTLGLFISCSARMAGAEPAPAGVAPHAAAPAALFRAPN